MTLNDHATALSEAPPVIERARLELKRRNLTIARSERLSHGMLRLHFTGEDLADFASLAPDDHIKLFIPNADGEPFMREYTPRRFDTAARTLIIDFAVHDAGPATSWALKAQAGDTIEIGGPRGSALLHGRIDHWLLIGDETAIPAIGRRIEEAAPGVTLTSVMAIAADQDRQSFEGRATHREIWVTRPVSDSANAQPLITALNQIELLPATFVWIAAEAKVAKAIRTYMTDTRGLPAGWFRASGYWQMGEPGAHMSID